MLKFYYNGIKDSAAAKLQKCHYSYGGLINAPLGTITIYAKEYNRFNASVREMFEVKNDTDSMTDYFENDTIRVEPTHPLYGEVFIAYETQEQRYKARAKKRALKYAA